MGTKKTTLQVVRDGKRQPSRKSANSKQEPNWKPVAELSGEELIVFKRIQKYMDHKKLWRSTYVETLANYVKVTHMLKDALTDLGEVGSVQIFSSGARNVSAEFTVYSKLLDQQNDLASQLGFNPRSWKQISGTSLAQLNLFDAEDLDKSSPLRQKRS